jgi:hypothetical protein
MSTNRPSMSKYGSATLVLANKLLIVDDISDV